MLRFTAGWWPKSAATSTPASASSCLTTSESSSTSATFPTWTAWASVRWSGCSSPPSQMGCSLELIHLGKRIRELLGMTHLLKCFTIIGEQGVTLGF